MNKYLLQIILFGSVYLTHVQSQANNTSTMLNSFMSSSMMTASSSSAPITSESHSSPTAYSSSAVPISSSTGYSASSATISSPTVYSSSAVPTSSSTGNSASSATISSPTGYSTSAVSISSPTGYSSSAVSISSPTGYSTSAVTFSSPTAYSTSKVTVVSSSYTSATTASITSAPITLPINTNITIAYKYVVISSASLKPGIITNRTVLDSVQAMVRLSFNLANFTITVLQVEIKSQSRATTNETNMIATNLFQSNRNNCDQTCITNAAIPTSQAFQLPLADGSLASVTVKSAPVLPDNTITTIATTSKYQNGERPPGLAAQLGMGLGISLISLLIIGEIAFLYWKYVLQTRTRESNYQLPAYHN